MKIIKCRLVLAGALAVAGACSTARATTIYMLNTLVTFNNTNGSGPYGSLVADASGNLYGTTTSGGANGDGVVYEIAAGTHALSTVATFNGANGNYPTSTLTADASGNLYGTTEMGGASGDGIVYEVSSGTHALSTVATFSGMNGASPFGALVVGSSGNLYGTTVGGGANNDGTVYKIASGTHSLSTLAVFNNTNGSGPLAGLAADAGGNLYGTTDSGGAYSYGVVFKVAAGTNALSTLATFNNNTVTGAHVLGTLRLDANGNLYGTTQVEGANNDGNVFKVAVGSNAITPLFSFDGTDGNYSDSGVIADANGNLYGTTYYGGAYGGGTVFELNPSTGVLTDLFSFDGADGRNPVSGLFLDASGNLYGTTYFGGANGDGTVFELSPVPEPSSLALGLLALSGLVVIVRTKWSRPVVFAK